MVGDTSRSQRAGVLTTLAALAIAVVVTAFGMTTASAQDDAPTLRAAGVIHEPEDELLDSLAACEDIAALGPGELIEVDDGTVAFIINGDPSAARYVAEEELANVGANTAVGQTAAILGQLFADGDNNPMPCSRFDVDMRTLESNQSRRDNFLRDNTLESDAFPVATFVLRGVEGLEVPITDEETTFTLIGDFTFHGTTQLVAWEATVKLDGDGVVGSAYTEFLMEEFDITPPIVGSVISIDDLIRLEVDVDARPAA